MMTLLVVTIGYPSVRSQTIHNFDWPQLQQFLTRNSSVDLVSRPVRLDGRELFKIGDVSSGGTSKQTMTPIDKRVEVIEALLSDLVIENKDPDNLQITVQINNGQSVIYAGSKWLMTVTAQDTQVAGYDQPSRWAIVLADQIQQGLTRASQERQPAFLFHQSLITAGILVVMLASGWLVSTVQHRLKNQCSNLQTTLKNSTMPPPDPAADSAETSVHMDLKQRMAHQRHLTLKDIQRRLLQLLQVGIWGGGGLFILGLFPYTRWLQPLVLSTPLQVISVILLAYLADKVSDALIERFFDAFEGELTASRVSHRFVLRVSTFSQVGKSLTTLFFAILGAIVILSILGVNLTSLVAGVGLAGIAITLASQNVIKDMISGCLILLEDQYALGDIIVIDGKGGLVENMNLRITQLRNPEGRLITIPNGTITVVENLTKDWARIDFMIKLAYGTDPDRALTLLKQLTEALYQDPIWGDKLPELPQVLGVEGLDYTGVAFRVWIKTKPMEQWVVAREFRRRLKLALDDQDFEIGTPQQFLWLKQLNDLEHGH